MKTGECTGRWVAKVETPESGVGMQSCLDPSQRTRHSGFLGCLLLEGNLRGLKACLKIPPVLSMYLRQFGVFSCGLLLRRTVISVISNYDRALPGLLLLMESSRLAPGGREWGQCPSGKGRRN